MRVPSVLNFELRILILISKVREAGLEPATSRLSAGCSSRLSYPRKGNRATGHPVIKTTVYITLLCNLNRLPACMKAALATYRMFEKARFHLISLLFVRVR